MVANESVPLAMTFNQIKEKAVGCSEMKMVGQALLDGRWDRCIPIYKAASTKLS